VEIAGEAPADRQRVEPTIAVDPHNSSIIVAGAQDLRLKAVGEHRWHGYYRSTDRGQTWTSSLLPGYPGDTSPQGLASALHRSNTTSDPVLAFDRTGNLYYAGLAFNLSATTAIIPVAFVAKYTNDGATFAGATLVQGIFADKPWIAVDTTGGPSDGNVYLAYDAALTPTSNYATVFTRSVDGGKSFSAPFFVPADQTGGLPGVTVDSAGNIYVSTDASDPVTGVALNYTQVSKLTNGGTTLVQNVKAVNPAYWLFNSPQGGSFRAFTIPQIASDSQGVYLVWDDVRLGNANVYLTRSTDRGTTWSSPQRVNDVVSGQHFFPTVTASGGTVTVAWYDSRFSPPTTMTALDVFYAQSTDAGVTFSPSYRVTSTSFNPNIVKRTDSPGITSIFMGDYIGISSGPGVSYPIWTDNRNACDTVDPTYGCVDQDVFTATLIPIHNVTATRMRVSRSFDYNSVPSNPIIVNVTVANTGTVSETFTVTLAANSTIVASRSATLTAGATNVVSVSWHAELLPRGNYTLFASAVYGPSNLSNGAVTYGPFTIFFPGDLDRDCRVDIVDVATVAFAFGSTPSSPNWNPYADLNNDGTVNIVDVATAAFHFGQTC
jgi:hypothetical protein